MIELTMSNHPGFGVDGDDMATLLAEAATGVPPEDSRLAPLTPGQLGFRLEVGREVTEATAKGMIVEIPPEIL